MLNPWLAAMITLLICLIWMRLISYLAKREYILPSISRKIIHIGTGPIFLLCWLLFQEQPISRYLAAIVPFLIVFQLTLVGFGLMKDVSSVKSMARTGGKSELLKGPMFYGITFVLITIFFWKSVYAIVPLMILCGGDGMADLIGSKFVSKSLPWNGKKTIIGSISMFLGGFLLSILIILAFNLVGLVDLPLKIMVIPVLAISFLSMIVESLTPSDYDNITVPAIALLFSLILL